MTRSALAALAAALAAVPAARADVKLPAVISDHAVLQRDAAVPVWGWAEPGEKVTVTVAGQSKTATAGDDGTWRVAFDKLAAGGPHTLEVKGKNALAVKDVLVGEVWLGSGQSNMAWKVNKSLDYDKEKVAATFPQLRMFREDSDPAKEPKTGGTGKWEVCSPGTVGDFSATAYFFGRELHQTLNVPVGLINSSVGGTPIEAWTSWDAQKSLPELKSLFSDWDKKAAGYDPKAAEEKYQADLKRWKEAAARAKEDGKAPPRKPQKPVHPDLAPHHPATLFNGKINPLIPYAIRGVIWYQGENNAGGRGAANYGLQLRTMIADWRGRWKAPALPFAWVQLPNFRKPQKQPVEESGWVTVQEEMTKTLAVPHTGMAITLDVGEADDIHPKNKQAVGKRLALWALAAVYKKAAVVASGPLYAGHKVKGDDIVVSFKYAEGLSAKGSKLEGFAVAAADGKWEWAKAKIDGETVVVSHPDGKPAKAVRYAWAENPKATLVNGAGLPAGPFRTDAK